MMRRPAFRPLASAAISLPWVALLAGALALSGCQQRPAGKPVTQAQPAKPTGKGIYKVGTPYQIDGVWYYPAEDFRYEETGIASWYGEQFHAKETANGEVFDLNALTAAHRTLPMPSIVEVTNLENGRVLQLRVNDRGPFARGRILDVSRRAAQLLGFEPNGTAKVRVRILVNESIQVAALARRNGGEPTGIEQAKAAPRDQVLAEALVPTPGGKGAPRNAAPLPRSAVTAQTAAAPPPPSATAQLASAVEPPPLSGRVSVVPVSATQIYVQAGSFTRQDNAARVRQKLDALGPTKMTPTTVSGVHFYRVRVGPLASVEEADKVLARVVESGHPEAKIVVD
jgi:rare lipoprotein A